jgi:hypothetical protein
MSRFVKEENEEVQKSWPMPGGNKERPGSRLISKDLNPARFLRLTKRESGSLNPAFFKCTVSRLRRASMYSQRKVDGIGSSSGTTPGPKVRDLRLEQGR